jgi:hypothetical protein
MRDAIFTHGENLPAANAPAELEPAAGGLKLSARGWRVYVAHLGTYLPLMIFAVLIYFAMVLALMRLFTIYYPGADLPHLWRAFGVSQKLGITGVFLLSMALYFRAMAASMLATSEFADGRTLGALPAFLRVGWKPTRLMWLAFAGFILGPLAPLILLAAGFLLGSALPAAAVENLGVVQAVKRGEKLGSGNQARIATIYATFWAVLVLAAAAGITALIHFVPTGAAWPALLGRGIFLVILSTVLQWYLITLTLNYQQQRAKIGGELNALLASASAAKHELASKG